MIRKFGKLLYGSVPAEFRSDFDMQESIRRLQAETVSSVFRSLHKQTAVGTVTDRRVSIQRVIPMVGNSFKPFFKGRFEDRGGRVVLAGRFTMLWFVKVFLTVWFGFCALWVALATFAVANQSDPSDWWAPLAGVGMFLVGITFVRFGQWLSRKDIEWLSDHIRRTLAGDASQQGIQPDGPASGTPAG